MVVVIEYCLFEEERKEPEEPKPKRKRAVFVRPQPNIDLPTLEAKFITKPDFDPNLLAAKNAHPLDCTITITHDHKYFVKWYLTKPDFTEESISVSALIDDHFPKFVGSTQVQKMAKDDKGLHVGKYKGKTSAELLHKWETDGELARNTGTMVHFIIECFLNGMDIDPFRKFKVIGQFLRWYQKDIVGNNLIPFRTELKVRSDAALKLTGTIDALFIQKNHPPPEDCGDVLELVMIDWKFTEKIDECSRFNKTGYGVCAHLDDCKKNRYGIQQHAYKYLLERFYSPFPYGGNIYKSVRIVSMALLILHDSLEEAVVFPISGLATTIDALVNERLTVLASKEIAN